MKIDKYNNAQYLQKRNVTENEYTLNDTHTFLDLFYKSTNLKVLLYSTSQKKILSSFGFKKCKKLFEKNYLLNKSYKKNIVKLLKLVQNDDTYHLLDNDSEYLHAAIPIKKHSLVVIVGQIFFDPLTPSQFSELVESDKNSSLYLVELLENTTIFTKEEFIRKIEFLSYSFSSFLDNLIEENCIDNEINQGKNQNLIKQNMLSLFQKKNFEIFQYNSVPMLIIKENNRIVMNLEFSRLTNYDTEDLVISEQFMNTLFQEKNILSLFKKRLENKDYLRNFESKIWSKFNEKIEVIISGEKIPTIIETSDILLSFSDITELRETKKQILFIDNLNVTILQNLTEMVTIIDKKFEIYFLNNSFKKFLTRTYGRENFNIKKLFEMVTFITEANIEKINDSFISKKINTFNNDFNINGTKIILEIKAIPIIEDNIVSHMILFLSDTVEKC